MKTKQITLGITLALLLSIAVFLARDVTATDCHYGTSACLGYCGGSYYCHPAPTSLPKIGGCSGDQVYVQAGDDCGTCVAISWPHWPNGENCGPGFGVEDYICW